jgi:hypothetical protein
MIFSISNPLYQQQSTQIVDYVVYLLKCLTASSPFSGSLKTPVTVKVIRRSVANGRSRVNDVGSCNVFGRSFKNAKMLKRPERTNTINNMLGKLRLAKLLWLIQKNHGMVLCGMYFLKVVLTAELN